MASVMGDTEEGLSISQRIVALNEEQQGRITGNIPAGIFGTPEDVAATVAFLASAGAQYITGQTLHVNGGLLMV